MQLTLQPQTKGQRPPPFDGPPTAISCGGDAWGDAAFYVRSLQKYMDVLARSASVTQWSIETLGLQEELGTAYRMVQAAARDLASANIGGLGYGFADANDRLEQLEDHFFSHAGGAPDLEPIDFDAGWIGPNDPTTLITLNEVRTGLLAICREIRDRRSFAAEENELFASEATLRINQLIDLLFRISGPDEYTWLALMGELSEAGRILKARAFRLALSLEA